MFTVAKRPFDGLRVRLHYCNGATNYQGALLFIFLIKAKFVSTLFCIFTWLMPQGQATVEFRQKIYKEE